jgi:hypothetical protein
VTEPGNQDERITALEADVAGLKSRLGRAEQDAAAARYLAGGADRDVGEIRAEVREFRDQNNRVLNAMREDLTDLRSEMRQGFAGVQQQFAGVQQQFAQVDANFLAVRGQLDGVAALLHVIATGPTNDGDDRPGS